MAIYVDKLLELVDTSVSRNDEIIIICGYFSIDILEQIAKTGKPITYYYGMYLRNGLSPTQYSEFKRLESTYTNIKINIPISYHVHTKCYLFKKNAILNEGFVGSANASNSALCATANSELLTPVDVIADGKFLMDYYNEIDSNSVHYDNPLIFTSSKTKPLTVASKRAKKLPTSWNNYTGNPFSASIPLYYIKDKKPVVHNVDGLNWGNGPHASKNSNMEAVIPIRKFHVDNYPLLIPFNGTVGSGSGGKVQRMQNPIDMIWDDGTTMTMLFQQGGTEVPSKGKRKPGDAYRQYPKALTSNSGGEELGVYLRKRLGLPPNAVVTYEDLRKYGRDYVTLTLTSSGNYELDFSI